MVPDPDRGFLEVYLDLWSVVVIQSLPLLTLFLVISLVLASVAAWLIVLDHDGGSALHAGLFVAAFAIVALAIGFSTANTRTPVLGEVLPLLLTGVGALFLLGYVQAKIDRKLLILGVFSFVISVMIGMTLGAENRERAARPPADTTPDPNIRLEAAIDRLTLTLLAAIALQQQSTPQSGSPETPREEAEEHQQNEARESHAERTPTFSLNAPACDCSAPETRSVDLSCTSWCAAMSQRQTFAPEPGGTGPSPQSPPVVYPFGFRPIEDLLRDYFISRPPIRLQSQ